MYHLCYLSFVFVTTFTEPIICNRLYVHHTFIEKTTTFVNHHQQRRKTTCKTDYLKLLKCCSPIDVGLLNYLDHAYKFCER